jgi:hypothetical protein
MDERADDGERGTEEEIPEVHSDLGCERRHRSETHDQVRAAAARVIAVHGEALERLGE